MRTHLTLAWLAASYLPVLAAAPAAPTEEVIVNGNKSLRGIWRITLPASATAREASDAGGVTTASTGNADTGDGPASTGSFLQAKSLKFGPPRQQLCRIGEDALTVRCISFGLPDDGIVSASGSHVTMSWRGGSAVRMILRGALQSDDRFSASFLVEQDRIRQSDPDPLGGDRINLAATTDEAGLSILLQGTLAGLALGDASLLMPGAPDVAVPKDQAALGRVQAVYYVGQAPLLRDPQARPALEVYAVEYANGERLCGIHLAHGKVDGLRCV